MNITDFNPTGKTKLGKMNKLLSEQFGIKINGAPERKKLERIMETANQALIQIRGTQKKFHLDPEYIKFLGLRDAAETMIAEGNHAQSPAYQAMAESLRQTVRELMDAGYGSDDACSECMNRARMNASWAFGEDVMGPIITNAATQYIAEFENQNVPALEDFDTASSMSDALVAEMASALNLRVADPQTLEAIAERIGVFAEASGRSSQGIVEFLNGLNERDLASGIGMFGNRVGEGNEFSGERDKAIKAGKNDFTVDGKTYPVQEAQEAARRGDVGMFTDLIDSILNEEVALEQAEVVMAVRSLADDVQSQIERISDMMNKDVPAIADQMRAEQGATVAQQFSDTISGTLGTYLESAKACKSSIDSQVMTLSGEAPAGDMGGLGDTALDAPAIDGGSAVDMDAPVDTNEPAAAGPEDEPLGRAEV
jgi:hypothetical protein